MGVHHNLVLFLRMVLFMKRFWQKIPFGQRVQFWPAHVFGGHHYELVGIQVWTLFDGDIVCNDWGGSLQSLRWPRWAREDPRNLGVIDQRGRTRRPGDPQHNRSSIVATGSPGAAQEKGGGGRVGWEGLSFTTCARNISHTTCYPRHQFPSHLKSHLLLALNIDYEECGIHINHPLTSKGILQVKYVILPVNSLSPCVLVSHLRRFVDLGLNMSSF